MKAVYYFCHQEHGSGSVMDEYCHQQALMSGVDASPSECVMLVSPTWEEIEAS